MEPIKGIDISHWQGDFNFSAAKSEGFEFAIIKAGGGDAGLYIDDKFERNYYEAKRFGMLKGAYFFSKALTVDDANREADFFASLLQGKEFELPVYVDIEHDRQLGLGKRALTDIAKAFCSRMEAHGFWAGIYSSLNIFRDCLYDDELQIYAHWIAQWASKCNYTRDSLGIWQYGGEINYIRSNKVAGVTCDQNILYLDYPEAIKKAGLNGFAKPELRPAEFWPPRDLELKMQGQDVASLQALLTAHGYSCNVNGIFDDSTRLCVIGFQNKIGQQQTGIADRLFWRELVRM